MAEPVVDERPTHTAILNIVILPGTVVYPIGWTRVRQFETIETDELNETMNGPLPPNS